MTRTPIWRITERLRITPTPYHEDGLIDALTGAMVDVWERRGCRGNAARLRQNNGNRSSRPMDETVEATL